MSNRLTHAGKKLAEMGPIEVQLPKGTVVRIDDIPCALLDAVWVSSTGIRLTALEEAITDRKRGALKTRTPQSVDRKGKHVSDPNL